MFRIAYSGETNIGKVRSNNEDNIYLNGAYRKNVKANVFSCEGSCSDKRALFAVCDGMGGDSFGEVASLCAVKALFPAKKGKVRESAEYAIYQANAQLCERMSKLGKRCGTTLAALYIADTAAVCCNVGDSRVYLYRDGSLSRLSEDHSKAQTLVRLGTISEKQARNFRGGHELTQYLGIFEHEMIIEPHFSREIALEENDIFLLCSDGLTDMLSDDKISLLISEAPDARAVKESLISAALENGGVDNVSVIVLSVCRNEKHLISKNTNSTRRE